MSRRICLYFGSFNPLHLGHLALARYAREQLGFDGVWLVLSPVNPHKSPYDQLPYAYRAKLIREAIAPHAGLRLCTIEDDLPHPHYTVRTLRALGMLYPHDSPSLLIGADNLLGITRWYAWERLLASTPLYVYPRPGYDLSSFSANDLRTDLSLDGMPTPHICWDAPQLELSSSAIRSAARSGLDLSHYLPVPDRWAELCQHLTQDKP